MHKKITIVWCILTHYMQGLHRHNFFIFCSIGPLLTPKTKIWKNCKKTLGDIILLYLCTINQSSWWCMVPEIWCMVPEIWNSTDRIFFLSSWATLTPWKMKISNMKTPLEISSFYTSVPQIMLYYSWDMAPVACNCYFSFWAIFSPFIPLTAQKIKISHTKKKHMEVSSFNTSVQKIMIICFIVSEIWHLTDVVVSFHFGLFFNLLPH